LTAWADDAGMMTQQLGFNILTAPLAAIDRRALSQAWYSALRLAGAGRPPHASSRACAAAPPSVRVMHERESQQCRPCDKADTRAVARQTASAPRAAVAPERRAERSPLARRIERTFLNPLVRPQRATFTVDGTRARVHVTLQTTPAGVRIVAVCSASIRTRVLRALDEARYALGARGISARSDVTGA
jgi:hypothetical protein